MKIILLELRNNFEQFESSATPIRIHIFNCFCSDVTNTELCVISPVFGFQGLINFNVKKKKMGVGERRDKMADWGIYHDVLSNQTSKLIVIDNRAA